MNSRAKTLDPVTESFKSLLAPSNFFSMEKSHSPCHGHLTAHTEARQLTGSPNCSHGKILMDQSDDEDLPPGPQEQCAIGGTDPGSPTASESGITALCISLKYNNPLCGRD